MDPAEERKKESYNNSNQQGNDGNGNRHGYCKRSSCDQSTAAIARSSYNISFEYLLL